MKNIIHILLWAEWEWSLDDDSESVMKIIEIKGVTKKGKVMRGKGKGPLAIKVIMWDVVLFT